MRIAQVLKPAVLFLATLVLMTGPFVSPSAAAPSTGATPQCNDVRGTTLAWSTRWRIVKLPGKTANPSTAEGPSGVIACRAGRSADRVRVLGNYKYWEYFGEDTDSPSGGPYVRVRALQADRAVIEELNYVPGGGYSSDGSVRVIDLAAGVSAEIGPSRSREADGWTTPVLDTAVTLLPSGAMLLEPYTRAAPRAPRTIERLVVWDGSGKRDLGLPERAAVSRRTATDSGGIYLHEGGTTRRRAVHGQARLAIAAPAPELAWQQLALRAFPRHGDGGGYTAEELTEPSTVNSNSSYGDGGLWLEYSHGNDDPRSRIQITRFAGEERIADLARGSIADFRLLSEHWGEALVVGRFSDRPQQRRVRLLGASKRAGRFFDRPALAGTTRPGSGDVMVAGTRKAYALVERGRVRHWAGGRGRVHRIPGAHDLALTESGDLFLLDAGGHPRLIRR